MLQTFVYAEQFYNPYESFQPISSIYQGEDSEYLFLKDRSNEEWIFKQYKNASAEDQIDLVFEVLASQVAQKLQIPINYVELVKASDSLSFKMQKNEPGSLHKKVLGVQADQQPPWENFDIQQKFRSNWMIQKKGPLASEEKGLRKVVLENISKHPALAQIVALDTYLGNMDRSLPNIFYDQESNAFYGIDMGNSFKGNLAQEALTKIKELHYDELLTSDMLLGLKTYNETLKMLLEEFPAEVISSMLDKLCIEIFEFNLEQLDEDAARKLKRTKLLMNESYESTLRLIDELS